MTLAIVDGDVLLYLSMWNMETVDEAKDKFDSVFSEIMESVFAKDYVMAFGGPNNFRNDLYSEYKLSAGRVKSRSNKPTWFDDLKSHAVNYDGSILCDGYEADDQVRIWALEVKDKTNAIVVSVDKDLDCIEGLHYNPRNKNIYTVEEDYADYFYWKQLLMGDSTDNIPGIEGIGPKKAEAYLINAKTQKERKALVCKAYYSHYPKDGFNRMLMNGKLLHLWRTYGDHFVIKREFYDSAIK